MGFEGSATAEARHYQVHKEFASPRDHLFLLEARDRSKGGVVQGRSSLCEMRLSNELSASRILLMVTASW